MDGPGPSRCRSSDKAPLTILTPEPHTESAALGEEGGGGGVLVKVNRAKRLVLLLSIARPFYAYAGRWETATRRAESAAHIPRKRPGIHAGARSSPD